MLDNAEWMPLVTSDSLPAVMQALAPFDVVVVVEYDEAGRRLAFYRQDAWLVSSAGASEEAGEGGMEATVNRPQSGGGEPQSQGVNVDEPAEVVDQSEASKAGPSMSSTPSHADRQGTYEDETSEQRSMGSISLDDIVWYATLVVPITGGTGTVFIELDRRGGDPPGSYRGDTDIDFSLPTSELDDVLRLLLHLVAQARRDGVLPSLITSHASDRGHETPSDVAELMSPP